MIASLEDTTATGTKASPAAEPQLSSEQVSDNLLVVQCRPGWRDFEIPLAAYVGRTVEIRFAMYSNSWTSTSEAGWYVDTDVESPEVVVEFRRP